MLWGERNNQMKKGQVHITSSPFPFLLCYVASGEGGTPPTAAAWRASVCRIRKKKCWPTCSCCGRNSVTIWGRRRSSLQQRFVALGSRVYSLKLDGGQPFQGRGGVMVENTHKTHSAFSIGSNALRARMRTCNRFIFNTHCLNLTFSVLRWSCLCLKLCSRAISSIPTSHHLNSDDNSNNKIIQPIKPVISLDCVE